jgi:hypothetical protein
MSARFKQLYGFTRNPSGPAYRFLLKTLARYALDHGREPRLDDPREP